MGYSFGTAMGGAVLLETVFSYPGVGSLMVESVRARDTQVIVGVVILIACSVVVMNHRGRSALRLARSENSRLVSATLGSLEGHRCLPSPVR